MRRGRALLPHPEPVRTSTRELASIRVLAHVLGVHVDRVRRAARPVACDVATRAHLLDAGEVQARLRPRDMMSPTG